MQQNEGKKQRKNRTKQAKQTTRTEVKQEGENTKRKQTKENNSKLTNIASRKASSHLHLARTRHSLTAPCELLPSPASSSSCDNRPCTCSQNLPRSPVPGTAYHAPRLVAELAKAAELTSSGGPRASLDCVAMPHTAAPACVRASERGARFKTVRS
eukprot:1473960-Rhodomonas_salina.1